MALRIMLALLLIVCQVRSIAQIEELTTTNQIVKFVSKVAPEHYGTIKSRFDFLMITRASLDSLVKTYHLQSFEKADLDGNGMTDLIFNGSRREKYSKFEHSLSLAILSFGKDSFYVRELKLDHFEDVAAHLLHIDGKPYIQTIRVTQNRTGTEYHIDTLAWAFNAFVEKMPTVKRKILQIDYTGENGLAYYSNINLRIINDSVRIKKEWLDGFTGLDGGGVFLTRLDSNTNKRLYGLLDAIDFVSLKESYQIGATDATTGTITITYDGGATKTISDYGTCGTYGLAELHDLLYGLKETQHWVNADPMSSRCIDSLHSDAEVLGLVRSLYMNYPFLDFEPDTPVQAIPDYRERLAAFGAQRWQKADIDGNGHTDLLFNGYLNKDGESRLCTIIALSFEGDSLRERRISWANAFFAAKIIRHNGNDVVHINYLEAIVDSSQEKCYRLVPGEDTLTAHDGQLLELPPSLLHHIEKLSVREEIGDDSMVVSGDTIYWYKNDAPPPPMVGDSVVHQKDSINLYTLVAPDVAHRLLTLAAGIRFERLDPDILLPDKNMQYFSSTWYIEYDGGKQSRVITDGLMGSFRLQVLGSLLWELKHNQTDWKFVTSIQ